MTPNFTAAPNVCLQPSVQDTGNILHDTQQLHHTLIEHKVHRQTDTVGLKTVLLRNMFMMLLDYLV